MSTGDAVAVILRPDRRIQ